MKIQNPTSLKLGFFWCQKAPPAHHLSFVVKGTFALTPGRSTLAQEQEPLCGDSYYDGETAKGCRYPSDFAPFKPRADVMVVGRCHVLGGAKQLAKVGVRMEGLVDGRTRTLVDKAVAVIGDRKWTHHPASGGRIPSSAEPFESMPLRFERAFGGAGAASNPIGTGAAPAGTQTDELPALPNLELPETRIKSPEDRPATAWLGALDRRWADRASLAGTYGADWLAKRWPWFPEDFDWGYFNAAPRDQQVSGYLRGDEQLTLEGLHPTLARLETTLPGVRPRCFVRRAGSAASDLEEVKLVLDTVWVDAESGKLIVAWRGAALVRSKHFEDVAEVILGQELLEQAPQPAASFLASEVAPSIEQLADEEEAAARAKRPPAKEEDAAEDKDALEDARKMLREGNAPSELQKRLEHIHTLDTFLAVLRENDPKPDPSAAEAAQQRARAEGRRMFEDRGIDPSILDPEQDESPPDSEVLTILTREEVIERRRVGQPLSRVDLSGVDLSGIDFSGAQLKGSCLARTLLDGTIFASASMAGVDLREAKTTRLTADLSGAVLTGAKLHGAVLPNANFERADLTGSDARNAVLAGASLVEAVLTSANLEGADLTRADATSANLAHVVLRRARMIETKLEGADLEQASLNGADLTRANLTCAQLEGANLSGASLPGAVANKAILKAVTLDDADATGADLSGADLSGATLDRCKLDQATLAMAFVEGAKGRGLSMAKANLTEMRASGCAFPGAVLDGAHADRSLWSGADLSDASLVRAALDNADFTEARLERTSFDGAVMKQANLTRAQLGGARLTKVNLFRGFLEGADLSEADCRGSNFFECELLDAVTTKARFDRSNLLRTKLDPRNAPQPEGGAQ